MRSNARKAGDQNVGRTRLEARRAVVQQVQHVEDVLGMLNHEIKLHVKFTTNKLQREERETSTKRELTSN